MISPHSRGVCAVLVVGLLSTLPTLDSVCYVLCCAYAPAELSVCWGRGGAHMCMHASSVLVAMSVCVMHPPTRCDTLFFLFYLFYQSRLERFVFYARTILG